MAATSIGDEIMSVFHPKSAQAQEQDLSDSNTESIHGTTPTRQDYQRLLGTIVSPHSTPSIGSQKLRLLLSEMTRNETNFTID